MSRFRTVVKLTFALLAVWLGLVWAGLLPRPAFLPPELDIEPLTFLLGTIAALLFGFWKNNAVKSEVVTGSHRLTEANESLQTEIKKYLKSRYEHRIRQKLAGREPVNLRKIPSSTGTSDEGAQNFITLPAEKVPSGMAELFDEARGRLLVVGAPGAGKTTLLLQLALELLKRADTVPAALAAEPTATATKVAGTVPLPIPVLLNLATWRSEFTTFDDWLQRILPLELGASKALAEKIRRNTPLILLLDGLDEVPEADRASCLKAIGEYGAEAKHRFVISSRIAEYAATQDAPVYLEVEVQPLTPQQVIDNLTAYVFNQPEAKPLLNALQTDSLLREAIANPFYLNTAQLLFATGRKYSEFGFTADDVAGRQRELVERFVEDALERKVKREYPKEKTRKWLSFLAGKMEECGKVVFELVDIQPRWIKNRYPTYLMLVIAIIIFSFSFIGHFNWGWSFKGWWLMALIGLWLVYTSYNAIRSYANLDYDFKPTEIVRWKFSISKTVLLILLGGVLLLLNMLYYEKEPINFFILGVSIGTFQIVLLLGMRAKSGFLLVIVEPYQRFKENLKLLGFAIVVHFANRFALFFESSLPLRLVTFLNEMSLRHLLEFDGDPETGKGGGSWRWRHRIIQEYFLNDR